MRNCTSHVNWPNSLCCRSGYQSILVSHLPVAWDLQKVKSIVSENWLYLTQVVDLRHENENLSPEMQKKVKYSHHGVCIECVCVQPFMWLSAAKRSQSSCWAERGEKKKSRCAMTTASRAEMLKGLHRRLRNEWFVRLVLKTSDSKLSPLSSSSYSFHPAFQTRTHKPLMPDETHPHAALPTEWQPEPWLNSLNGDKRGLDSLHKPQQICAL